MSDLRIFSYLPNPRIMKATIAARLNGVTVDVRGTKPRKLADWLWDFDARPLTDTDRANEGLARPSRTGFNAVLHKTEAFLDAHPFGTVPAAFSPDGVTGIFESNSILRMVARVGETNTPLYGNGPYEASRIDSFLDVALVFARQSQIHLLSLSSENCTAEIREETTKALDIFLSGINRALHPDRSTLVGESLSIADICVVCEIVQISRERAHIEKLCRLGVAPVYDEAAMTKVYPLAMAYFQRLRRHAAFAPDIEPLMDKLTSIAAS
ncbi:MAG: glutathione S-transferase [Alphaproteobacteria bacterium]|nr:glutathione S-transferase [Alphaproteobacteria bacterium]